jgi:hypothetical protein
VAELSRFVWILPGQHLPGNPQEQLLSRVPLAAVTSPRDQGLGKRDECLVSGSNLAVVVMHEVVLSRLNGQPAQTECTLPVASTKFGLADGIQR